MRGALLDRVTSLAAMIDTEELKTLSGTPADRDKPYFRHLSRHLTEACSSQKDIRFLYLMGKRDGKVFFYVDSQPHTNTAAPLLEKG